MTSRDQQAVTTRLPDIYSDQQGFNNLMKVIASGFKKINRQWLIEINRD